MIEKKKRVKPNQATKERTRLPSTQSASKKVSITQDEKISVSAVHLLEGKGSKGKGGDKGGFYWHIHIENARAGFVFINWINEMPFGEHASIQIKINARFQNRGIGRIAYRLACEASGYDTIFAHMRKSNIASRKAAEAAGFQIISNREVSQLAMVWNRPPKQ